VVGDGIVLWRMCVVWSKNRVVIGMAALLVFVTAGMYFAAFF